MDAMPSFAHQPSVGRQPSYAGPRSTHGTLFYAGQGPGDNGKDAIYNYVGYGGDSRVPISSRLPCILANVGGLALLGGLAVAIFFWPSATAKDETPTDLMFDCDQDFARWEEAWTDVKKAYCCDFKHRGCPTEPSFDAKQENQQLRAAPAAVPQPAVAAPAAPQPTAPPPPPPPAPTAPPAAPPAAALPVQVAVPPPPAPVVPAAPAAPAFDCNKDLDRFVVAWTIAQKAWCCKHEQKGCVKSAGCSADTSTPCPGAMRK